jgi:hypothetical protein
MSAVTASSLFYLFIYLFLSVVGVFIFPLQLIKIYGFCEGEERL